MITEAGSGLSEANFDYFQGEGAHAAGREARARAAAGRL